MNSRYKQSQASHHLHQSQRNMFLPIMICSRSSPKDVKLSHFRRRSDDHPTTACSAQPNRNNKLTAFPTPNHHHNTTVKYHKLGKLFSTKSLTATATELKLGKQTNSCYANTRSKCKMGAGLDPKPARPIKVAELDPPLPVVRRPELRQTGRGGEERESLWKRRSGEAPLRSLQVQSVHHGDGGGGPGGGGATTV